jgi:hypothetical protein
VGIAVVLTEGFDGDDVVLTVGNERRQLHNVATKLLTGFAEQLQFDSSGDTSVRIEVVNRRIDHTRTVASGKTVLICIHDGALQVTESDQTPGFM